MIITAIESCGAQKLKGLCHTKMEYTHKDKWAAFLSIFPLSEQGRVNKNKQAFLSSSIHSFFK